LVIKKILLLVCITSLFVLLLSSCTFVHRENPAISESRKIVSDYKAVFTAPPEHVPSFHAVDGPITGNGDIGVVVSGKPEKQRYWISKNDFWKSGPDFKQAGPSLIGGIDVSIDELKDASYHVEQLLYEPVINSEFSIKENTVIMDARVLATDDLFVLELKSKNKQVQVNLDLWVKDGYGSKIEKGTKSDVFWVTRKFIDDDLLYPTEATIAMRNLGSDSDSFILEPDHPVFVIASVRTNHETGLYKMEAIDKVIRLDSDEIVKLKSEHNRWWRSYWAKSYIHIEDTLLEKYYYASNYIMACCSRNINFPPGLYGNWITMDRLAWSGDIHLNYNYEAAYWALYSSNRVEIADPYDTPLIDALEIFKEYSKKYLNTKGAYAPVAIGPKGLILKSLNRKMMDEIYKPIGSTSYESLAGQPMFLGQKSNAVFASMNMIMRYYYTYDEEYIRMVYPYLSAVAEFWEDYLCFENGRYVIYDDSYHEVGPWQGKGWENGYGDFNSITSLGLLKVFFKAMMDIGKDINEQTEKLGKWQHIYKNLSDFPISEVDGRKRFRACEGGDGAARDIIGLNKITTHGLILPATNIGLSAESETLKMIYDDIREWNDDMWLNHGLHTLLNAATRVGYDTDYLMSRAKDAILNNSSPNFLLNALENQSGIPGMINEMMLQYHGDVISIFPVFPDDQEALFYRLRTVGAFLVSAAIDNGQVKYAVIESEKGRECKILNPWQGRKIIIYRDGKENEIPSNRILKFNTEPGDRFILAPSGSEFKRIKKNY